MIRFLFNIVLNLYILIAITSCTTSTLSSDDNSDLSFSSIMLGKEFPDSLIHTGFKYYDSEMPSYEGKVSFKLPSSGTVQINVVARIDPDTKQICLISLSGLNMSQLEEFYNMLRAKYGDPATPYGEVKSSFSLLLYDSRRHMDLTPEYIQDKTTWAIWHPEGYDSTIEICEYFYYQSKRDEPLIYISYKNLIAFKIASEKAEKIRATKKAQEEYNKRENYKRTHSFMNQDF